MLGALMALLIYSGSTNDVDWLRRVGHLGIMSGLIWAGGHRSAFLAVGGAGLATGLIVGHGTGAGRRSAATRYPGRLTGFLADPNAGAYFIAVLGCLAIFFCDNRTKIRLVVAVPILAGLVLTYSRTGLLAGALADSLVGGRPSPRHVVRLALPVAGFGVWAVNRIPESLTTVGPFSDRSGSDALRNRIIAQERVELADAPWFGNGPGTATVEVREQTFFFHNSYLATRQEGGWVALLLILGLLLFTFLRLSRQARAGDMAAAAAQAAIVGTAVMAITLGEVLLDTPTGGRHRIRAWAHCSTARDRTHPMAEWI